VVLVDEASEQVPSGYVSRAYRDRVPGFCERWGEGEGAMGPPAVVVLGIGPECSIEMAPPEAERPVEALRPDRRDDPFGVGNPDSRRGRIVGCADASSSAGTCASPPSGRSEIAGVEFDQVTWAFDWRYRILLYELNNRLRGALSAESVAPATDPPNLIWLIPAKEAGRA